MKELIKQYLDRGISRRNFLAGLSTIGLSSMAANAMARSLAPFAAEANEPASADLPSWMRRVRGTGGALFIAQLKAAGVKYFFYNPSTPSGPMYDALVDEPDIHPILALQEGSLAAMADGYSKASGKTSVLCISSHGVANCMSMMLNSRADNIPVVVVADDSSPVSGEMVQPITKWRWNADKAENIPVVTRRAFKFASTQPCGPVFISCPGKVQEEHAEATVMDQAKFNIPMKIRPDQALVEQAARMLLEARNPLLYVGDEITWCRAQKEVVELAELLGIAAARPTSWPSHVSPGWSRPFPTRHPLYVGDFLQGQRYPQHVDLMVNLGNRAVFSEIGRVRLIQVRMDPTDRAGDNPTEVFLAADLKLAMVDLLNALRSMATPERLKQLREARFSKTQEHTSKMRAFRESIVRSRWNESHITLARLGMELEQTLEKDTYVLSDSNPGWAEMHHQMSYGGDDKQWLSQGGTVLGWSVPAAFGVKLALPDRPVVAVMGDGAFLFAGPQPLWTMARYHAPVTVIVINNRSYSIERTNMFSTGGRQFQTGRDMVCYLGTPDIDYAKMAVSTGVESEVITESSAIRPALERAKRANMEGRPYLVDMHVAREGLGATSTWHPPYSIADRRTRKV